MGRYRYSQEERERREIDRLIAMAEEQRTLCTRYFPSGLPQPTEGVMCGWVSTDELRAVRRLVAAGKLVGRFTREDIEFAREHQRRESIAHMRAMVVLQGLLA